MDLNLHAAKKSMYIFYIDASMTNNNEENPLFLFSKYLRFANFPALRLQLPLSSRDPK